MATHVRANVRVRRVAALQEATAGTLSDALLMLLLFLLLLLLLLVVVAVAASVVIMFQVVL
jgi:hypothetical protein